MHCYSIKNHRLSYVSRNIPETGKNEVLIKVKAVGMNRADLLQLQGKYPSPDGSDIPGLEISGIREDTGGRVCALLSGGGYAECVSVPREQMIDLPDEIDFITAAAIPEAITTCWLNLYQLGKIKEGMNVLIHGGASGIGTMAVQLALLEKCHVFATSSNKEKLSIFEKEQNFHSLSFKEEFSDYIRKHGKASLILDILGGRYFSDNIRAAAKGCKIISIAAMDGKIAELNLGAVLMKNISVIGSTLRSKNSDEKGELFQNAANEIIPLIKSKKINVIIDSIFAFEKVHEAVKRMQSRDHVGKIVLSLI